VNNGNSQRRNATMAKYTPKANNGDELKNLLGSLEQSTTTGQPHPGEQPVE
jgi:hypothetical protein